MTSLKDLQEDAEQKWTLALEARRVAVKAENKYKEALYKWLEEGDTHAVPTPEGVL